MRNIALAGALVVAAALALLWGLGRSKPGGSGRESPSSLAAGSRGEPAVDPEEDEPRSPPASTQQAAPVADLKARDQRRRDAIAPFSMSVLSGLDRCVTPGPGPRVPQRLLLRFSRSSKTTPGHETFELKSVSAPEGPPGQSPMTATPLGACLSSLAGQTLLIPTGSAPQESTFEEIITVPVPASLAWASPQPPPFPQ